MDEKIVIFGAGGHGKVVIDAVECEGRYTIAMLADVDISLHGSRLSGYTIGSQEEGLSVLRDGISSAFVAIGNNETRCKIAGLAMNAGLQLVPVIHPGAIVARSARIGAGTLVMPGSVINADSVVGANVIINTGAVVEHDCEIGDGAHIAPNATICGGATVGTKTLIGAGAVVLPGVSVGSGVVIGAGSTVISNVASGSRAAGSPCRVLKVEA